MKLQICLIFVLFLFYATNALEDLEADNTVLKNEKIIAGQPIVIQTEARTYDQPTLAEYQKCHQNLENCLRVCNGERDVDACKTQCPTCPILLEQGYVVQGVNDTEYKSPIERSLNSTNVVNLTNEIRNIIHHNMGNITAQNVNNIDIQQQNVSSIGGQFGLGYNNNGSCCYVLRDSKYCDNPANCPQKRHKVCGEKCKSRVMHAKLKENCVNSVCKKHLVYIPHHVRKPRHNPCNYMPSWPYVRCQSQQQTPDTQTCQHCMQLSYGYILRNGMPMHCSKCFGNHRPQYNTPIWYGPPATYYGFPNVYPPALPSTIYDQDFNWENEFIPTGDDWKLEKTKCRDATGNIIENCEATIENVDRDKTDTNIANNVVHDAEDNLDVSIEDDGNNSVADPLNDFPEAQDDAYTYDDDNADETKYRRHRRNHMQHFLRSSYSHRYKQQNNDV